MNYVLVFVGAGIGGVLRFLMSQQVQKLANSATFPFGTFAVNMLGCLVIGLLASVAEAKGIFSSEMRLFTFVGILGGYTTFSSFAYESFQLLRDGELLQAAANAVLQTVLGLVFVWVGWIIGRLL